MSFKSVAVVINDIAASGGTERVAAFLVNKLASLGMKVTLVSITKRAQPFYPINEAVCVSYVGSSSLFRLGLYLKRLGCDTVISVSMGRLSFNLAILFHLLNIKSRLVLSEHVGFETSSFIVRSLKLLSYYLADQLVILTQHDFAILKSLVSTPIVIIPNPSVYSTISISELSEKKPMVLAVGRLNQQKNFEHLIRIWAQLSESLRHVWMLKIVGSGEEKERLLQLVSQEGVTDSVVFSDASPNIHSEYQRASILSMTSRYEGLPLVLIEAKSFGLPVIAFDCKTGPAEIISHGDDGFLIVKDDDTSYINHLKMLMTDDELRNKMSVNAIQNSVKYSEDEIIKLWEAIL